MCRIVKSVVRVINKLCKLLVINYKHLGLISTHMWHNYVSNSISVLLGFTVIFTDCLGFWGFGFCLCSALQASL